MHTLRISLAAALFAYTQTGFSQVDQSATDSLRRSQVCAQAAKEYMKRPEWSPQLFETQSYTSHYNGKLNKCFVNVQRIQLVKEKNEVFEMNHVYDAIEGRAIGGKLLTKKPIGADPKVVSIVLVKDKRVIKDPTEAATLLTWFDGLMED